MTKYINADKLIHDLEERIYAYSEGYANGDDCRKDAIETLLKDVKYQLSLQQEQPEVDLEEEIDVYLRTFSSSFENGIEYAKKMARHFYELGVRARKGE